MARPRSAPTGTWPEVCHDWCEYALPIVVCVTLKRLGCPKDRVQVAAQDAVIEILERQHSLNFPEYRPFFAYFRMITSWRTQRSLGRAKREHPFHDLLVELLEGSQPNSDDIEHVRWVLNQLTPEDQKVLELRFVEELTYEEIAAQLGISLTTARQCVIRASGRFRKLWYQSLGERQP